MNKDLKIIRQLMKDNPIFIGDYDYTDYIVNVSCESEDVDGYKLYDPDPYSAWVTCKHGYNFGSADNHECTWDMQDMFDEVNNIDKTNKSEVRAWNYKVVKELLEEIIEEIEPCTCIECKEG